jgi:outer membrane protein assembly factor BamB
MLLEWWLMHCKHKTKYFGILILLALTLPLASQDWPMWGGSIQRNMFSSIKNLPSIWDIDSGKNIKWKAQLGSTSYGNPVVADGKVFLGTNNDNPKKPELAGDKGVLMCLRESDGAFLWQAVSDKLEQGYDWPEQGVCSSPVVESKRLFYVSNRAELICLDTEGFMDGENAGPFKEEVHVGKSDADIVWKLDMMKDLGIMQHNMANSSPVIWGDMVFLHTSNGLDENNEKVPAPDAPSFIAVNKNTGKVVWQDNSPGNRILHGQWSSPALGESGGIMQAFFPGGDGLLYGFDALKGQKLWSFDLNPKDSVFPKTRNYVIATPVFFDGKVYIAVGQDPESGDGIGHMYCIDPTKRGDITQSGCIWRFDKIRRSISTAAISDGLVYISDFAGFLHCLDAASGKPYWTFDMLAAVWGSPMVADGKVYLGDEDGDIAVFQAGKELKKISEMNMGGAVYGAAVAANGALYIMNRNTLYAISQ